MNEGSSSGPSWGAWGMFSETTHTRDDNQPLGSTGMRSLGAGDRGRSAGTSTTPTNMTDLLFTHNDPHQPQGEIHSVAGLSVADHLDPELPAREPDTVGETSYGKQVQREASFLGSQDDQSVSNIQVNEMISLADSQSLPTLLASWR
jgi:hypothetical protein